MDESHCKSVTLEVELHVIHQIAAGECAVDVAGLSLPPIYKYDAVLEEEDDVQPISTASRRALFVFKCLVIVFDLFMHMCVWI